MDHDIWLVLVGAAIGLASAIFGGYVKHILALRAELKRNQWKCEEERVYGQMRELLTDPSRWFPEHLRRSDSSRDWSELLTCQLAEACSDDMRALIRWQQDLAEALWQLQEERVKDLVCLLADLEELEPGIMASSGSEVVDKIMESQRKRVSQFGRKKRKADTS